MSVFVCEVWEAGAGRRLFLFSQNLLGDVLHLGLPQRPLSHLLLLLWIEIHSTGIFPVSVLPPVKSEITVASCLSHETIYSLNFSHSHLYLLPAIPMLRATPC